MISKCVKLVLVLALVIAVAFGVSFLPFSLSDKFKQVAGKLSSSIKELTGLNKGEGRLNLDFSKRDNYKIGEFNVVFDRVNNVPKEGFHKFVHKGENDATLDVEKFFNGETELEGIEGGVYDYAAGYFKGDSPHLLLVELALHEGGKGSNNEKEGEKKEGEAKADAKEGDNKAGNASNEAPASEKKVLKTYYAPGENNKWVKLGENANLSEKVEETFNALSAASEAAAASAPANKAPEGGNAGAAPASQPTNNAGAGAPNGGENSGAPVPTAPAPARPEAAAEGGDANLDRNEGANLPKPGTNGANGNGAPQQAPEQATNGTNGGSQPAEVAANALSGQSSNNGGQSSQANSNMAGNGQAGASGQNQGTNGAQNGLRGSQGGSNQDNQGGAGGNTGNGASGGSGSGAARTTAENSQGQQQTNSNSGTAANGESGRTTNGTGADGAAQS